MTNSPSNASPIPVFPPGTDNDIKKNSDYPAVTNGLTLPTTVENNASSSELNSLDRKRQAAWAGQVRLKFTYSLLFVLLIFCA